MRSSRPPDSRGALHSRRREELFRRGTTLLGADGGAGRDEKVRQKLSRCKGWAVGQIISHTDLAGHPQTRVKRRKAWEERGYGGGPAQKSLTGAGCTPGVCAGPEVTDAALADR